MIAISAINTSCSQVMLTTSVVVNSGPAASVSAMLSRPIANVTHKLTMMSMVRERATAWTVRAGSILVKRAKRRRTNGSNRSRPISAGNHNANPIWMSVSGDMNSAAAGSPALSPGKTLNAIPANMLNAPPKSSIIQNEPRAR